MNFLDLFFVILQNIYPSTNHMKLLSAFLALLSLPLGAAAQYAVNYEGSITAGGGSGEFSPYYINALRHGRFSQQYTLQAEAKAWRPVDRSERFSYGFGIDLIGNATSSTDYERYDAVSDRWYYHSVRPSAVWLQQFYGEVKYRSVFLLAGMKEHESALLNQRLTSGDLIESGNTRPIPEVRAGFIDFQDIPFTNGWVQIQGEIGYGRLIDDGWRRDQYNYYNYHISRNEWYNYKRCYFRTKPSMPFSVTVGMQAAAFFGGVEDWYSKGVMTSQTHYSHDLNTFFKMLLPTEDGGEAFYTGNHLGSWDLRARYRLDNGTELSAYFSWPWEDGSGIGKQNGWDGLWGLEYRAPQPGIVSGAVAEYMDYTNQSGPIHFAPADFEGTTIPGHASGADDYYNNRAHNSYAYFGHSIGTPAIMAPIYNTGGYPGYVANVMRGFHIGIEGQITPTVDYVVKGGYRKAWGNGYYLLPEPIDLTAVMVEATWHPAQVKGLSVNGRLELDRGSMPCNAFGAMVTVKYDGLLKF